MEIVAKFQSKITSNTSTDTANYNERDEDSI